jgi:hypothetical protein
MSMLVNILILFFIILIGYQLILANHIVEGLETTTTNSGTNSSNTSSTNTSSTNTTSNTYTPYDTNNPSNALILSQQNAGNIDYLKQRMDAVQNMFQEVQDLSGNVSILQEQVAGLVGQQQDYAAQLTGGTAPNITGTTDTTTSDTTTNGTTTSDTTTSDTTTSDTTTTSNIDTSFFLS